MKSLKKRSSTQELIGIKSFSRYGLETNRHELVFFSVSPTNISVLSPASVEVKIRNLMMILTAIPDIEIVCLDACECFDSNKQYLQERLSEETNEKVRDILRKDFDFLDNIQVEMSTARQFLFVARLKKEKDEIQFQRMLTINKAIFGQGFEVKHLGKPEIKRVLAIYFGASTSGELMRDFDGEQYLKE